MQVLNRQDVYEFHRPLEQFWSGPIASGFCPNPEYLDLLYQQPAVLANLSTEHWGDNDYPMCVYMHDVTQKHQNMIILSHNPDHDQLRPNIFYFPFWLRRSQTWLSLRRFSLPIDMRRHYLSCICFRPRAHRIRMLREIHEAGLDHDAEIVMPDHQECEPFHDAADQAFWQNYCDIESRKFDLWDIDWPPYTNAWLQIVLESSWHDGIFLTEKTWKCIAAGQFFVMLAGRDSVKHIHELGFDTFHDIIPHYLYDGLSGYQARCTAIISVLHDLRDLDWADVYHTTRQRRQHNRELLLSGKVYQPYIQKFESFLQ